MIKIGERAPDFKLKDQDGNTVSLSDYRGKYVVLYFYPKDETPGCTREACAFRDQYEIFQEHGAEVIGISSDSVASHKRFAENHHIPFKLLSDTGGKVRKLYGVPNDFIFIPGRVTFLIDKSGVVRHTFNSQLNIAGHINRTLDILKKLKEAEGEKEGKEG